MPACDGPKLVCPCCTALHFSPRCVKPQKAPRQNGSQHACCRARPVSDGDGRDRSLEGCRACLGCLLAAARLALFACIACSPVLAWSPHPPSETDKPPINLMRAPAMPHWPASALQGLPGEERALLACAVLQHWERGHCCSTAPECCCTRSSRSDPARIAWSVHAWTWRGLHSSFLAGCGGSSCRAAWGAAPKLGERDGGAPAAAAAVLPLAPPPPPPSHHLASRSHDLHPHPRHPTLTRTQTRASRRTLIVKAADEKRIVIGLAADSGEPCSLAHWREG